MLSDITKADIALGKNFYASDHPDEPDAMDFLFEESYERIAQGLYEVGFAFTWLGDEIIESEFPFDDELRTILHASFAAADKDENYYSTLEAEASRVAREHLQTNFINYGVCDYPEQVLEKFPAIGTDPRRFIITFTSADKDYEGDFRWHKQGEYIGEKNPMHESFRDEGPEFKKVYLFHVIQLKETGN